MEYEWLQAVVTDLHTDTQWQWECDNDQCPGDNGKYPATATQAFNSRVISWNMTTEFSMQLTILHQNGINLLRVYDHM